MERVILFITSVFVLYWILSNIIYFFLYLLHKDVANWHTSKRVRYVSYKTIASMLDNSIVTKSHMSPTIYPGFLLVLTDMNKHTKYYMTHNEMVEIIPGMFETYLICKTFSDYKKVVKYLRDFSSER